MRKNSGSVGAIVIIVIVAAVVILGGAYFWHVKSAASDTVAAPQEQTSVAPVSPSDDTSSIESDLMMTSPAPDVSGLN